MFFTTPAAPTQHGHLGFPIPNPIPPPGVKKPKESVQILPKRSFLLVQICLCCFWGGVWHPKNVNCRLFSAENKTRSHEIAPLFRLPELGLNADHLNPKFKNSLPLLTLKKSLEIIFSLAKYLLNPFFPPQTRLRLCCAQGFLTRAELLLPHKHSRKANAAGFGPRFKLGLVPNLNWVWSRI